jgi:hypothetical protein
MMPSSRGPSALSWSSMVVLHRGRRTNVLSSAIHSGFMSTRVAIPAAVQEEVLTKSARRCAFCFGLDGKLDAVMQGQIAHVDRDNTKTAFDDLAWLCLVHHDAYDSKTSQSKGLIPGELRIYRDRLYVMIAAGEHLRRDVVATAPVQIRAEVLEHDRETFKRLDALLPEPWLWRVLDDLAGDHSYYTGQLARWEHFRHEQSLESNQFIVEDVQRASEALGIALDALITFNVHNLFVYPERQKDHADGTKVCLHPDINVDRGGRWDESYFDHAKRLKDLVAAVTNAYREYRRTVKRTLIV